MIQEVLSVRDEIVDHLRSAVQAQSRLTVATAKRGQGHLSLVLGVQPEVGPPHLPMDARGLRVGAEFQGLDASIQEAIARCVTPREREDIHQLKRELP